MDSAKLQLSVSERVVRLVAISVGGKILDEEVWVLPTTVDEGPAEEMVLECFGETYDLINLCVHGSE